MLWRVGCCSPPSLRVLLLALGQLTHRPRPPPSLRAACQRGPPRHTGASRHSMYLVFVKRAWVGVGERGLSPCTTPPSVTHAVVPDRLPVRSKCCRWSFCLSWRPLCDACVCCRTLYGSCGVASGVGWGCRYAFPSPALSAASSGGSNPPSAGADGHRFAFPAAGPEVRCPLLLPASVCIHSPFHLPTPSPLTPRCATRGQWCAEPGGMSSDGG